MLENKEGQRIPSVVFKARVDNQWAEWTTESLFANKRVIVFALPGAFTPTCSSSHVPRYNELFNSFYQLGIDEIMCLSVNDAYVMNAWQEDQNAPNIRFLPDGNGSFSEAIGMLVSKDDLGFGQRSWRYSMLVNDGVIEKMFIEPNQPGDPFQVSDADTMLRYLDPEAKEAPSISLFTKQGCPHCTRAKNLLTDNHLVFNEVVVNKDVPLRVLRGVSGHLTVPQIFINGELIGGADELKHYFSAK